MRPPARKTRGHRLHDQASFDPVCGFARTEWHGARSGHAKGSYAYSHRGDGRCEEQCDRRLPRGQRHSGTLTDSSSGVNTVIGLNQSIDTTLVFDISRKTWTRTNVAAAISIGLADESRGRYAICAGVTALMPSATLTISGARGRVHFIASLKELSDALRRGPVQ